MGRAKEPEQLRQTLLDQAARLIVESGLTRLTTEAVAQAAGVSKGGLFHHFPSKPALIHAVAAEMLAHFDAALALRLAGQEDRPAAFTRAYIAVLLEDVTADWTALSLVLLSDPEIQRLWEEWMAAQLKDHAQTDAGADLAILRLAADGIWISHPSGTGQGVALGELYARLAVWLDQIAPSR